MKTTWPRLQYGKTIRPSKNGKPVLRGRPERGGGRQLAHREGAGPSISKPRATLGSAVIRETDLQTGDRLLANAVLRFEPGEDFGVPDQPLVIDLRQCGQRLAHAQREPVSFFGLGDLLRATAELRQGRQAHAWPGSPAPGGATPA
jgi:hypothetical protein